jgi:hypothetical protein
MLEVGCVWRDRMYKKEQEDGTTLYLMVNHQGANEKGWKIWINRNVQRFNSLTFEKNSS